MARQEATNTFSDGMIKDLNPINVPNTALTDCLNGTIVTYDGNEYSLQNDKGNYPLENCKLDPNYIPVGLKEYGDILYIVSYNPLTKKVQVGSYPAPNTIFDSDGRLSNSLEHEFTSILNKITSSSIDYSDLVEDLEDTYIYYGADDGKTKLDPGDQYKISNTVSSLSAYEDLEYYIFDENRKSYNITEKIQENTTDTIPIGWEIPGWLAVKQRWAEISDFTVNIKKIVVPTFNNKITLKLNLQLTTSDDLIKNCTSSTNYLKAKVIYQITGGSEKTEIVNLNKIIDMHNGNYVYYNDWTPAQDLVFTSGNILSVKVEPYIVLSTGEGEQAVTKTITYNKFNKHFDFNLNTRGTVSDLNLATTSWWYNTNNNDKSLVVKFNTEGLSKSSVLDQDVYLYYSLKRLDNTVVVKSDGTATYSNIECDSWNMIGDTLIEFELAEYSATTAASNKLFGEDIYKLTLELYNTPYTSSASPIKTVNKLIVASELMNSNDITNFDNIYFDDWIGRLKDSIQNKVVKATGTQSGNITYITPQKNNIYTTWINGNGNKLYKSFISDTAELSDNPIEVTCKATYGINVNYSSDVKLLYGPLWSSVLNNSYVTFKDNKTINNNIGFNQYTGKLTGSGQTSSPIQGESKRTIPFIFVKKNSGRVWDYTTPSIRTQDITRTYTLNYTKDNIAEPVAIGGFDIITKNYNSDDNSYREPHVTKTLSAAKNSDCIFVNLNLKPMNLDGKGYSTYCGLKADSHTDWLMKVYKNERTIIDNTEKNTWFVGIAAQYNGATFTDLVQISAANETSARSAFNSLLGRLKHLKCDPTTEISGGFYIAEEATALSEDAHDTLQICAQVIFPLEWTYKNKNLLNKGDRETISESFTGNKNFLCKDGEIQSFSLINLESSNQEFPVQVDFDHDTTTIQGLTAIRTAITTRNSTVNSEYSNYINDQTYYKESDSDIYYYEDPVTHAQTQDWLTDILNSRKALNSKPLRVYTHTIHNSKAYDLEIGLTVIEEQTITASNG